MKIYMMKWTVIFLAAIGFGQHTMAQKTDWEILLNPKMEDIAHHSLKNYFASFSKIKSDLSLGKTDHFCSYETTEYENGIRYSIMDNGPCEQCGNHLEIIYIPEIDIEKAYQFFIQLKEIKASEVYFQVRETNQIHFHWEFGEVFISNKENGILINNNIIY